MTHNLYNWLLVPLAILVIGINYWLDRRFQKSRKKVKDDSEGRTRS